VIELISAPTNLGLRPPQPGSVPGTAKAPEALRAAGLFRRFELDGARDGGVVLPGRYIDDDATRAAGARNETAMVDHARRLATRIGRALDDGHAPLVIGGDCSLLLGAGVALARRGRFGLVHVDGHTDFRHPGNSDECASVAGEDLAAAVGMHWPALANIDDLAPYFAPETAVHLGCREDDDELAEVRALLGLVMPAQQVLTAGVEQAAADVLRVAGTSSGYWVQVDVDVLDPAYMPAVDSPDSGGLSPDQLVELLRRLAPRAIGAQVTVFDPDLDPTGEYAALLTEVLVEGLADLARNTSGLALE
jgi:arginase